MNYKEIYVRLIEQSKDRKRNPLVKYDLHHILPKSLGGGDEESNLTNLTPREHYLAHLLLLKITSGKDKSKMAFAMFRFSPKGSAKYGNSKKYEMARRMASEAVSGENNPFFGKHLTDEHKQKISGSNHGMYGKSCYDVWVEKYGIIEANKRKKEMRIRRSILMSGSGNSMYGVKHTIERNLEHSKSLSGRKGMFKDGIQKRIKPENFDEFLKLGWSFKD